jgi:phosphopantothenoylcysteine decarboxylase/phosphopantothenate--cysteine ligase
MSDKRILLGVTGSIAAYKAAELVRLMNTRDWDVHVVMTQNGARFVGPITFQTLSQNPVGIDPWDETVWRPEHIDVSEKADVFVVAPCTANTMAKLAHGLADDLLSATALACPAPLIIAPAMNVNMWNHPATQKNLATLKDRGVGVVDVTTGDLACGYTGEGRMAEPSDILDAIDAAYQAQAR